MIGQTRKIRFAAAIAVFAATAAASAAAAYAPIVRSAGGEIRACVAEIGKRADYKDASRVLHMVIQLERKNRVELKLLIETSVYSGREESAARHYTTSCVTGALNQIVKFQIKEGDTS